MITLACKVINTGIVWPVGDKQGSYRTNKKLRRGGFALIGFNRPGLSLFIISRIGHPGFKLNVFGQIKALRKVFEVSQHRSLGRLRFLPCPVVD